MFLNINIKKVFLKVAQNKALKDNKKYFKKSFKKVLTKTNHRAKISNVLDQKENKVHWKLNNE